MHLPNLRLTGAAHLLTGNQWYPDALLTPLIFSWSKRGDALTICIDYLGGNEIVLNALHCVDKLCVTIYMLYVLRPDNLA